MSEIGPNSNDPPAMNAAPESLYEARWFRFSVFRGYDYIRSEINPRFIEINVGAFSWELRIVLPHPGFSLWRSYKQVANWNYPRT